MGEGSFLLLPARFLPWPILPLAWPLPGEAQEPSGRSSGVPQLGLCRLRMSKGPWLGRGKQGG